MAPQSPGRMRIGIAEIFIQTSGSSIKVLASAPSASAIGTVK